MGEEIRDPVGGRCGDGEYDGRMTRCLVLVGLPRGKAGRNF